MLVAIHQPNFFPWLGYFDKINRSDRFVILDNVQLPKTGGTWSNRVKVIVSGQGKWVTAPMSRDFHGVRNINQMEFDRRFDWRKKIIKTLDAAYGQCVFFDETMSAILPLIENSENNIAAYNTHLTKKIASLINIDIQKIHLSSEFQTDTKSNDLLVDLVHKVGGDSYIYGGGADGYQDDCVFERAKIKLLPQNFVHPHYPQRGVESFIPGLSIIDAFMNVGVEGVKSLLLTGAG